MKEVYPDYADQVDFYAVGYDDFEDLETLESFREKQGHPWPVAVSEGSILKDFNVVIRSSKVAFDSQGVITYRAGFYEGNEDQWHDVFKGLVASQ